jgi:hypothetical protein
MSNHSAATGLKTWIVIVARTGRPMTAEMTMTAATKWAQSRNNLLGEDTYSCKYVGI